MFGTETSPDVTDPESLFDETTDLGVPGHDDLSLPAIGDSAGTTEQLSIEQVNPTLGSMGVPDSDLDSRLVREHRSDGSDPVGAGKQVLESGFAWANEAVPDSILPLGEGPPDAMVEAESTTVSSEGETARNYQTESNRVLQHFFYLSKHIPTQIGILQLDEELLDEDIFL